MIRSPITTAVLLLVVAWAALLAVSSTLRTRTARGQFQALTGRIAEVERDNERRAAELERMQDPQWLALLARARLNYKFPDEHVVIVYKNEKSGTISQPVPASEERPSWRKWWEWLIGE